MVIYRKDQKIALKHLIPSKLESIPKFYDYIIASQAFRLRSPYDRTLKLVLIPLLKMLDDVKYQDADNQDRCCSQVANGNGISATTDVTTVVTDAVVCSRNVKLFYQWGC